MLLRKGDRNLLKKWMRLFAICLFMFMMVSPDTYAASNPVDDANEVAEQPISEQFQPKSVMIASQTGQILYDYHPNEETDPASLTKIMTMYLTLDAMKRGDIKGSDQIQITPEYQKMTELPNLSASPLKVGESYTVDQFLDQITLKSSNAATLILADKISGDSSKFTDQMNQKAKKLGMAHTHFTNPTGADTKLLEEFAPKSYKGEGKTTSTARDMNKLMYHIIKVHPNVLKYSKKTSAKQHGEVLTPKNTSLKGQENELKGADGLKTGTSDDGYNLALTAKRNGLRLNETILNVQPYPDQAAENARHLIANSLMEQQFQDYEYKKVLSKGEHKINDQHYNVKADLYDVVPKDMDKVKFKVNDKDEIYIDYPRQFIKGTKAPKVKVEKENAFTSFFKDLFE